MSAMVIPRRADGLRMTPLERQILDAQHALEKMPADPRLTRAAELLAAARGAVADWADEQPGH